MARDARLGRFRFRRDTGPPNPEELLAMALSAWHVFSYLTSARSTTSGGDEDHAEGMLHMKNGRLRPTETMLRPQARVGAVSNRQVAYRLHDRARNVCFIANSVNFPVRHELVMERAL